MSLRSQRSLQSRTGQPAPPLSDAEVYSYTLRVAVLQHVIANKPAPVAAPAAAVGAKDSPAPKRESLRRSVTEAASASAGSWSSGFSSALSLSDLFRSDSRGSSGVGSSPRYPERFVKVLEHRIETISRGTDGQYTDMLLRYTIGAFYGKFKDPKNTRVIKDNRKLEDLIMMLIATATEILRKRCAGDEWKARLDSQVESFISILDVCLRNKDVRHVPPELFTKLEQLKLKMASKPLAPPQGVAHLRDSDGAYPERSSFDGNASTSTATASTSSYTSSIVSLNISEMPSVRQIGQLFGIEDWQLQKDVNGLRKTCTEKAAMADLKACVNLISSNAPFPGCREDFPTEEAYREWRSTELSALQQSMLAMIQANPELVHSEDAQASKGTGGAVVTEAGEAYVGNRTSRASLPIAEQFATSLALTPTPSHGSSAGNSVSELDEGGASTPLTDISEPSGAAVNLTFIPPDARQAYRRLLELMLSYDLEAMADLDPSEEVPLRILSRADQDLLTECMVRWRVMPTYRFVSFLEDMSRRYSAGEMPVVECVLEALSDFDKLDNEWNSEHWPTADRQTFLFILSQIFDSLLRAFYETYSEQQPADAVPPILEALTFVHDNPLFSEAIPASDLETRFDQLKDGIRRVSDFLYDREREETLHRLSALHPPSRGVQQNVSETIVPAMLDLLGWIKATTKRLDRNYKSPLLGVVDVPQLFLERVPDVYLHELGQRLAAIAATQRAKPLYTTPADAQRPEDTDGQLKDGEVMALYQGVKEISDMHKAFCPDAPLATSVNQQFAPYILRWLAETDTKTLGWVRNAINLDDFKAEMVEEGDGHSSSIVDLIASCKGAVQFVTDLGWPDEVENARFLTTLSATVSKSIEQYCIAIEELFMREMTPPSRADSEDQDERTSAWLTRAKALYQEKKLDTFTFKPTSCVKLNNIHAARKLLDQMYTAIDADRVSTLTRSHAPPLPLKDGLQQQARNLFTVKIVLGEGLSTADGVSRVDPFVTLSDERGLRIAKTRTLYESTEPRWAETADVSVEGKMWIAATVWDRNLVDEHELLGRTYICLDPAVFGDFLPHDMWQELDTVGRLLLRVSMEGEKDDIQFYFGRAFRSLKRAENDMTRSIVDKISPFIRTCISQASLKSLMKKGGYGYFTNLKLDKAFEKARLDNVRQLISRRDPNAPEIPLPPADFAGIHKALPSTNATAGQKKAPGLTDAEIEEPLGPLLEYLDQCLETFRKYLSEAAWQVVMTKIWKEVLSVTEALLVPALSDQTTEMKPLADKEVDIVFKWLKFLTDFFYADGGGVPIEDLRNPRYRAVMMIRLYYDWSTDSLMEESVRLTNQQMAQPTGIGKGMVRSKSVYQQRNLGTIKQRKQVKNEEADSGAAEMVMRILRMRHDALDFLQQQMATLNLVQEKQRKPTRLLGSIRGRGRGRGGGGNRGRGAGASLGHRLNSSISRLPPMPTFNQYR